ncbi:MAG: 3-hydroxyacyl-CoA dehydrogenase NAD-binding domain-containing protein [Hyphomicrobiaceae bacterium]
MIILTTEADIAFITMNRAPVNALGHDMRTALADALQQSFADDAIAAIVIRSGLPLFCGGADIQEFRTQQLWKEPHLPEVIALVETAPKLVIAAINGIAMGGALELALACDYRIARQTAKMGLPEIKLGLLPGAGGTQRLPRVTGVEIATDMILSGSPIPADKALSVGLVDAMIEDDADFESRTRVFVAELISTNASMRRCRDMIVDTSALSDTFFDDVRASMAKKARGQAAPERCLQSIEAACKQPLKEGLKQERDGFLGLLDTPQARGLIHLFFAERDAQKIPGVPKDTAVRDIRSVAVIGAGTMGTGITIAFLDADIPVTLLEMSGEALQRGTDAISKHYDRALAKGRVDEKIAASRKALLHGTLAYDDLANTDLVIEAVFESMDVKKDVFGKLDAICKPGAILASNTSTLDLNEIAAATSRPEDVIGLHFFSPANIMRLLEIVRGTKTAPDVIQTTLKVAKAIRKVPVVVGVCFGFVGNRMLEPYFREGSRLMLEGASPEQIDCVLTDFGMAMGIVSVADLAGVDVSYRVRESRRGEIAHDPTYQAIQDKLFELGRYGQKTGRGSYIYEGRDKKPDPEVIALSAQLAKELGVERREISDQEILERTLYPLINEGIQILDEGIATRSGDCDIIWVNGYGFPAWRGGPLQYGEEIGLDTVLAGMKRYRDALGTHGDMWFQPAPLLERLVASKASLASLSTA